MIILFDRLVRNFLISFILFFGISTLNPEQVSARQGNCPDRFLKNAMYLLEKKKQADALATFNQIVRNFPKCPQAEEAQWQLIKYYSTVARSTTTAEYFQLAEEHISFYLHYWPEGSYRKLVLREREFNMKTEEPFHLRKGTFIAILSAAIIMTIALTLGSR